MPFQPEPATPRSFFLLRTTVPPDQIAGAVRAAVQALDPDVMLEDDGALKASLAFDRDFMDAEHSELGKYAKVAPGFAGIALLLSAIGLMAVIAHSVSQRTEDIGIRMAIRVHLHVEKDKPLATPLKEPTTGARACRAPVRRCYLTEYFVKAPPACTIEFGPSAA